MTGGSVKRISKWVCPIYLSLSHMIAFRHCPLPPWPQAALPQPRARSHSAPPKAKGPRPLAQELQRSLARHAAVKREAVASATQLAALEEQHSSLLSSLEAQDAEVADELERSKAELQEALVRLNRIKALPWLRRGSAGAPPSGATYRRRYARCLKPVSIESVSIGLEGFGVKP